MKFCFVLPKSHYEIAGGYKMVYEYANRLVESGHEVVILYLNSKSLKQYHLPGFLRRMIMDTVMIIEPRWFPLNRRVKKLSDFNKATDDILNKCDVIIATAISTTEFVRLQSSEITKGYLIQGFENWNTPDEEVYRTYNYGFKNIVVSSWLKKIVDSHSEVESTLISNPLDMTIYREFKPYNKRNKHSIGVLYNPNKCKGFDYALQAINILKTKYPDLLVNAFGAFKRPEKLPLWITYIKNASQEETVKLYNDVRVFLCASIDEGFGLTGFESMACGCVLVTSDFQGAREYVIPGVNALVSEKKNVNEMVENVCKVFEDNDLAQKIIRQGKKTVESSSWDKALKRFMCVFQPLDENNNQIK